MSAEGPPLPDLVVRLSQRVTHVRAQRALGLDILGRYTDAHFHVPNNRLTLSTP